MKSFLEMAEVQRRLGIMDDVTYRKITIRHLGPDASPTATPISADEIRTGREKAHLSQAALAKYLNLHRGVWSQLGRGTEEPRGRPSRC